MNAKSPEFRRSRPDMAEAIMALEMKCFPSPWSMQEIRAMLSSGPSSFTLVAHREEELVGYVSATFSGPGLLHLISICTDPACRGEGIATGLLSHALQWGRHLLARKAVLEVRKNNVNAIGFYLDRGFTLNGSIPDYYGPGCDALTMEMLLEPIPGTLETALYLHRNLERIPETGLILGSGLGWVAERFGEGLSISFDDIPGMSGDAIRGHSHTIMTSPDGRLAFIMGRRHHYQGYDGRDVARLPAALAVLGTDNWVLTSSSGAVDPDLSEGDAMVFTDHVNFSGCIPDPPPYPVCGGVYSAHLRRTAMEHLSEPVEGVFACVSGPAYETGAEVAFIRDCGCRAVSMSTVQEALALRALGCRVLAMSLITNAVEGGDSVSHHEVLSAQEIIRTRQGSGLMELIGELV